MKNYILNKKTFISYKMKKGAKQVSTKVIVDKEDEKENTHPNTTPMGPPSSPIIPPFQSQVFLGKKQEKTEYLLNDQVIEERVFANDVRVREINNERGSYVDIRKYVFGKPTKKGIRVSKEEAKNMAEWLVKILV